MEAKTFQLSEKIFLDFIDGNPSLPDTKVEHRAERAIRFAELFYGVVNEVATMQPTAMSPAKMRGCKACYGSGGKANSCKQCDGTGKVAV